MIVAGDVDGQEIVWCEKAERRIYVRAERLSLTANSLSNDSFQ
jgi:hypothetical protein